MLNHLLRLGFLIELFFFSRWAARLILFIGIPGALIAIAGNVINYESWKPLFVVGGTTFAAGSVIIYIVVVLLMFPTQLISVISSRQYGLLPYIRSYLAVLIVCVLLLLQVVAYCILAFGLSSDHVMHFSLIVAIMLIINFVLILAFVCLGSIQFLCFFALPVLGWQLVPLLKLLPDLALSAILVCLWITFLSWWFSWHPKKYYKNLIAMNPGELNKQYLSIFGGIYSRGAVPQDLASGILFGNFGGRFYQARMFMFTLVFAGIIFSVLPMLSSYDFGSNLMIGFRIGIALQIIQIGYNYLPPLFKNINKFWLYFSLERIHLFGAIERVVAILFLKNLVAITGVMAVISFLFPNNYLTLKVIMLSVLASLVVTAVTLYMVFIVYAKWRGDIKAFHWISGITMIIFAGMCFLGLEFFKYNAIKNYVVYFLTIIPVCLVLILVMRQYAKRLWRQVDLVRVAT